MRNIKHVKATTVTDGIKIQPQNIDDYCFLRKMLKTDNKKFCTHPLKEDKALKIVISVDMDVEETETNLIWQSYLGTIQSPL